MSRFPVQSINRTYLASVGVPISSSLPTSYQSAIFTNNSGHYCLLRLGGMDAPVTASAASRVIPPYSVAGVNLQGHHIGINFIDNAPGLAASFSTGYDGILDVAYNPYIITEYMTALPGSVQATITPPVPAAGVWSRISTLVDFDPLAPPTYKLIVVGPSLVRYAKIMFTDEANSGGAIFLYRATQLFPGASLETLAVGQIQTYATVSAYVPIVEWGPVLPGAEILVPVNQALYADSGSKIQSVLLYAEYRTP